jgi:hypothetical protein
VEPSAHYVLHSLNPTTRYAHTICITTTSPRSTSRIQNNNSVREFTCSPNTAVPPPPPPNSYEGCQWLCEYYPVGWIGRGCKLQLRGLHAHRTSFPSIPFFFKDIQWSKSLQLQNILKRDCDIMFNEFQLKGEYGWNLPTVVNFLFPQNWVASPLSWRTFAIRIALSRL